MPIALRARIRAARRAPDDDLPELRRLLAAAPPPLADLAEFSARLGAAAGGATGPAGRLLHRLGLLDSRGPRLLDEAGEQLSATEVSLAQDTLPALEPHTRGPARWVPVRSAPGSPTTIRQGRLGDCWFIAVLAACEHTAPGFAAALIRRLPNGLVQVRLHMRRPRWVTITARVPAGYRAGTARLRPNAAALVEKALAVTFGRGSYLRIQYSFAGTAFRLLTGAWCPARPVPRRLTTLERWLAAGRPVVASTLVRLGGAFRLPREDDPQRSVAVMAGHVYVVRGVGRLTEDGQPAPEAPARVHLHNPVGGSEGEPRRIDLYLSARQFRRAFISVNAGPPLR